MPQISANGISTTGPAGAPPRTICARSASKKISVGSNGFFCASPRTATSAMVAPIAMIIWTNTPVTDPDPAPPTVTHTPIATTPSPANIIAPSSAPRPTRLNTCPRTLTV